MSTDECWRVWRGHVFTTMSLDGYIARADGDRSWLTNPPALGQNHQPGMSSRAALGWSTFYSRIDHIVVGRATYEQLLTLPEWPYPDRRVLVVSTTLATAVAQGQRVDSRISVTASVAEAVELLNREFAREVYVAGGRLVQAFLRQGLVDELTISIAPVLLGGGIPLFATSDRDVHLELRATHGSESGMVHATYRVLSLGADQ